MAALLAASTLFLIDCAASDAIEFVLIEHLNGLRRNVSQKLWGETLAPPASNFTAVMEDSYPVCLFLFLFVLLSFSLLLHDKRHQSDSWHKPGKHL